MYVCTSIYICIWSEHKHVILYTIFLFFLAFAIFCIIFLFAGLAEATDYGNLCSLFKKNTKVRVPGSCDQYISCSGRNSQVFTCAGQTKYDEKQGKCVETSDSIELCENRCVNATDGTFMAHPTNCRAFYYCDNKEGFESYCGIGEHFHQARQQCVYPKNSQCIQGINNICDLVADKTVFRNEKDCSQYYKCDKNKLTKEDCKKLYFNVETRKCAERSTVQCLAHRASTGTCTRNRKPFSGRITDGATCRGYFFCAYKGPYAADLQPSWYQCPAGLFFDNKKEQCLPARHVKCAFNRCDGRGNATVVSGRNNCRNYLQCQNDMVLEEQTCKYHYFFDEQAGVCVNSAIYDGGCDDEDTHS